MFYVGRNVRDLHEVPTLRQSGLVEYVPISLGGVPQLFENGQIPLDVAMVQVAPPDPDGTCSLGISVDVTKAAALAARTVIAEVNPAMPRPADGQSRIPGRSDHARASSRSKPPSWNISTNPPAMWPSRSPATSPA